MRGLLWLAVAAGMALVPAAASAGCTVTATPVSYSIVLAQDANLAGPTYTVKGFRYSAGSSREVVLLLHGLSYGYWGWDFRGPSPDPNNPYQYALARYLAVRGIDTVAIDELGYGSSDHPTQPDSRQLTIPAYANMAHQIIQKLHPSYAKVVIAGHSAGGEISNFEAGRYQDVDALADISFCDAGASSEVVLDAIINDAQGLPNDYIYFGSSVDERTNLMYYLADADPKVVAADNAIANLTPAAEMQSISPQPARNLDPQVNVPVWVAFSENDAIFPASCQQLQPGLYISSPKVTAFTLPLAGHALMTHKNSGPFEAAMAKWLVSTTGVGSETPLTCVSITQPAAIGTSQGLPGTSSGASVTWVLALMVVTVSAGLILGPAVTNRRW